MYAHRASLVLFNPAGPIGAAERNVILITVALSGLVIVPVFGMLFYFAWRYRAEEGTKRRHEPTWDHERAAEIIYWLIPSAIIFALALLAIQSSQALDPYKPLGADPLRVEVVALDWKWLFIYPDYHIASVNELIIPTDRPVQFFLTADAPMNSFWIPQLSGQIMVMPGMQTELNLSASHAGDYNGSSANISGKGFSSMTFSVHALPKDAFDAWVASTSAAHTPLSSAQYAALAQPSSYVPIEVFSPVAPDLFESIMMKYMVPSNTMTP